MKNLRQSFQARRRLEAFSGLRRTLFPASVAMAILAGCEFRAPSEEDVPRVAALSTDPASEVISMLQASADSWNGGDLEGFLDDYVRSDDLTFSGSTGVTRGWDDLRARYLDSYWAPGMPRDSLRFEDLEVTLLGEGHALVLGRYVLFRPDTGDSITSSGFFSLVLRRQGSAWRILHDHTSAASDDPGTE